MIDRFYGDKITSLAKYVNRVDFEELAVNILTSKAKEENSLGSCNKVPTPVPLCCEPVKECMAQQKKDKAMNTNNNVNVEIEAKDGYAEIEKKQRRHLIERLDEFRSAKREALRIKFAMDNDSPPESPTALRDRLAKGLFEILGEKGDQFPKYTAWYGAIVWRDPAKPADKAGYEAAKAALQTQYNRAYDDITIGNPADGLVTLRAFEAS